MAIFIQVLNSSRRCLACLMLSTVLVQHSEAALSERRLYRIAERRTQEIPGPRPPSKAITFSGDVDKIVEMANQIGRDRADAAADNSIPVGPVLPESSGGRDGESLGPPPAPTFHAISNVDTVILDTGISTAPAPSPLTPVPTGSSSTSQPVAVSSGSTPQPQPQPSSPSLSIAYMPSTVVVVDPVPTRKPTALTVSTDAGTSSGTQAPVPLTQLTNSSYWQFPTPTGPHIPGQPQGSQPATTMVPTPVGQTAATPKPSAPTCTVPPTPVDCKDPPPNSHAAGSPGMAPASPASPSSPGHSPVATQNPTVAVSGVSGAPVEHAFSFRKFAHGKRSNQNTVGRFTECTVYEGTIINACRAYCTGSPYGFTSEEQRFASLHKKSWSKCCHAYLSDYIKQKRANPAAKRSKSNRANRTKFDRANGIKSNGTKCINANGIKSNRIKSNRANGAKCIYANGIKSNRANRVNGTKIQQGQLDQVQYQQVQHHKQH
ncbi:expressed unknown protein [Seminavis robusta]|uniref:Uncharacterized protein n=1 Tax=Seminavis robusta TaxID=568900 RepID=A0A9N8DRR7_9STRA|nr:expressed unknown protein [Seminavis robusta]|eukprot:Sro305_g112860.1 n/a (489) ;mRNA; r:66198-67753